MTKTLTEQWREGILPPGCYYVLSTEDDTPVACDIDTVCDFMIRDVIAPVPSYDEYKRLVSKNEQLSRKTLQLEKRLEIATKALKDMPEMSRAQRALREMEGVK